jgi:hypothetical protein
LKTIHYVASGLFLLLGALFLARGIHPFERTCCAGILPSGI